MLQVRTESAAKGEALQGPRQGPELSEALQTDTDLEKFEMKAVKVTLTST